MPRFLSRAGDLAVKNVLNNTNAMKEYILLLSFVLPFVFAGFVMAFCLLEHVIKFIKTNY